MTVVDAGPLIALQNRNDPNHSQCSTLLAELRGPLVTTWPALTEAMFVLARDLGWAGQERLLRLLGEGRLAIVDMGTECAARIEVLMRRYRNVPMSLADATLVLLAETTAAGDVFTLDSDFLIYQWQGRDACMVRPARSQG